MAEIGAGIAADCPGGWGEQGRVFGVLSPIPEGQSSSSEIPRWKVGIQLDAEPSARLGLRDAVPLPRVL